jgi:hypothetical protein
MQINKKIYLYIVFIALFKRGYSENKFDTIYCKLLYNDYKSREVSLHFDGGDQLYLTPNFFKLNGDTLTDTGFIFGDSLDSNLLNDSNHILLFSKRAKRRFKRLNAPAKDRYDGFHFYLFDAVFVVENLQEIKLAHWPAPSSIYGSEPRTTNILNINKIIKLTPIKSKKHRINKKNIVQ